MMVKTALLATLALAACSSDSKTREYSGQLNPEAGTCDPAAQAQLLIRGDTVVFVPNSGTITLKGAQRGNVVTATQNLLGADKKPYALTFQGTLHGLDINGLYKTGRCQYRALLHAVPP